MRLGWKRGLVAASALVALGALALPLFGMNWMEALGLLGQERVVRQRIEGYWNARVEGDLKAMAPYVHPLQKAIQEDSVLVTEHYEIVDLSVEGNDAFAKIRATYRFKHPQMTKLVREVTVEDQWVRYRGTWYHAAHPVGLGELLQQGLGKWKPPVDPNP